MEHRQEIAYQQDLFIEQNRNAIGPSENCADVYQVMCRTGEANK